MYFKKTAMLLAMIMILSCAVVLAPAEEVQAGYVEDFLATVGPMCTKDMKDNKILASFTMAQAIYESGWGRSTLAVEANNLFGMRAYSNWTGKVYDRNQGVLYSSWSQLVATKGNSYVNNNSLSFWRAYDSWQESVNDHSDKFNTMSIYENLRENYNYKSCCTLVVEDGYCTDSGYTQNLIRLIESYNLEQYNYVPVHFTFEETAQTEGISIDSDKGFLVFNAAAPTASGLKALFEDEAMTVTLSNGGNAGDSAVVSTGTIISSVINGNSQALTLVVLGDVTGDGATNTTDLMVTARHLTDSTLTEGAYKAAADVNADGIISSPDLLSIKSSITN